MKPILLLLIVLLMPSVYAQQKISILINDEEWKAENVSAGIETVFNLTALAINASKESEKFSLFVDYEAIKGKSSAEFNFEMNFSVPPGGASLSYLPKGVGKQQYISASGKLNLTEFNETDDTATGTFEGILNQMLDDNGAFILSNPPTVKVSGTFSKIKLHRVN